MATPVKRDATSRFAENAPIMRKKEYMLAVMRNTTRRLMKNWDAVRWRPRYVNNVMIFI